MSTSDKHPNRPPDTNRPPAPKTKGMTTKAPTPKGTTSPPKRSPVLLATVGAIAVGVLLVAVLVVAGGLPGGGSSTAIATPVIGTPVSLANGRSLGSTDAPIDIQIWADYQCPVCARFTEDIEPFIIGQYVEPGKAHMTFRDYAFIGPESFDAAVAARIADDQAGKFWAYHDLLFANQGAENRGSFSRGRLADMAVAVGLDRAAFLKAMADPAFLAAVKAETTEGQGIGVNSTPTMVVNGQVFTGVPDLAKFAAYLDSLVAAASNAPASNAPASNAPASNAPASGGSSAP